MLTRITETLAQDGSNSHGMCDVEEPVDDPEVVVQEALPDEQRQEAGDRVGDDQRPSGRTAGSRIPACRA